VNAFSVLTPTSIGEALALLDANRDAEVIAGGTSLVNMMKQRLLAPEALVSLHRIAEQRGSTVTDDVLSLGALMSLRDVETDPLVRRHFPMLVETLREVASVRIRNMATLGGALAHGDPNQDSPATLMALDASVASATSDSERVRPLSEFYVDYYETQLEPGELITEVRIPLPASRSAGSFMKFLPRSKEDYGVVTVATRLALADDGRCDTCRIALGCVGMTVMRALDAEGSLEGERIVDAGIAEAARLAMAITEPVSDSRGSAEYKKKMVEVFVRRSLEKTLERLSAQ
jgi:carbon-monoxide dehydrogenase medium subunit